MCTQRTVNRSNLIFGMLEVEDCCFGIHEFIVRNPTKITEVFTCLRKVFKGDMCVALGEPIAEFRKNCKELSAAETGKEYKLFYAFEQVPFILYKQQHEAIRNPTVLAMVLLRLAQVSPFLN